MKCLLPCALLLVSAAIVYDPSPAWAQAAPPAMSGNYLLLTTRSIFFNGRYRIESPIRPIPPKPQDTLVFVGAMKTFANGGSQMTGFILDNESGRVSQVAVGQNVAGGRILEITLDGLEFESGGAVQHILVGQNLAGVQVFGVNAAAASTMPSSGDFDGPHGDMLKLLHDRRARELNGGAQ